MKKVLSDAEISEYFTNCKLDYKENDDEGDNVCENKCVIDEILCNIEVMGTDTNRGMIIINVYGK